MARKRFETILLARDKRVKFLEDLDIQVGYRVLEGAAFLEALKAKVVEEATELAGETEGDKIAEEMADVYEAIDALQAVLGITKEKVAAVQAKKREKLGGFEKRLKTEWVEMDEANPHIGYYLARSKKYPVIG